MRAYLYAVTYDLGFAPNPFGGLCSLACCKPNIRNQAQHGDWIVGLTGTKLLPPLRCIFAMVVTRDMMFDQYWADPAFVSRRPKRNGSDKKLVGDNIYHRERPGAPWRQEDSVHSLVSGKPCPENTKHDTRIDRVLLSDRFIYFGAQAPAMPPSVRKAMGYSKNARDYRVFTEKEAKPLLTWLEPQLAARRNVLVADPIDFASGGKRFSAKLKRLV
jgi:hypothetical protein